MNDWFTWMSELLRLDKELDDLYDGYAAKSGMPPSAFWLLYAIFMRGLDEPYTQRQLCNDWFIPPQTVNSSLKRMQEKGLVSLSFAPNNKKDKLITLTDKGMEAAQCVVAPLVRAEQHACASISDEEREKVLHLLRVFVEAFKVELAAMNQYKQQGDAHE